MKNTLFLSQLVLPIFMLVSLLSFGQMGTGILPSGSWQNLCPGLMYTYTAEEGCGSDGWSCGGCAPGTLNSSGNIINSGTNPDGTIYATVAWSNVGYGYINNVCGLLDIYISAISISIPPPICSTGTLTATLTNPVTNPNLTWSSGNASELTINASSGQATRVNSYNGSVAISATYECGSNSTSSQSTTVWVGNPGANNNTLIYASGERGVNPVTLGSSSTYYFETDPVPGNPTSYTWRLPKGFSFLSGNNTSALYITTSSTSGNYTLFCAANNNCGSSYLNSLGITVSTSGGGGGAAAVVAVFPNPASTSLTVQIIDTTSTDTQSSTLDQPYQLSLIDKLSTKVFSVQSKDKTLSIPIESLPLGIYYLNVFYKDAVLQKQIFISK